MNPNRLLDVEFIQKKLDEGYQYTTETKGRDLVLVIGNTGVGKSTSCNYLLGYLMKEEKYKGKMVVETVEETPIAIGHKVTSETLYAKSFITKGSSLSETKENLSDICLLDCPGFLGNRTVEEKVIESVSTELAIRSARQIKGILILISLNILLETRVRELRELVKTLVSLLKDPVEMVQYSLFIITKKHKLIPDAEAREATMGALTSLKDHCEEQETSLRENPNLTSSEGLTLADYNKISVYFSTVLKKADNIILINPLDKGESRKLILDRINCIKPRKWFKEFAKKAVGIASEPNIRPITINDFSFSESNEDRVKFNKALYDRAREGTNLIGKIQRCGETNSNLHSEISSFSTRLSMLHKLLANFEEEICRTGNGHPRRDDFKSVKILESMIHDNDIQIESKKEELENIDKRKEELSEDRKRIDTDKPIVFIRKSTHKIISFWKLFGWEEMHFKADTDDTDVEIIKVDRELENGMWVDEDDRRENGIYGITYQSKYLARPASASVITYIKTKDEAGNKIRIQKLKEDRDFLESQEKKLKSEIAELVSKNKALQLTVTRSKNNIEDYEKNLARKLEEGKKEMQHIETLIPEKEEERKQAKRDGLQYLQEFECNRCKFEILISIASLLEFPSAIIKNFISEYDEFLACIDNYRSSFSESNVDSLPYVKEKVIKSAEGKKNTLKDPFTGDEIKHLVVTSSGTAFDEHSLLKQFDNANPSSIVFTREDGSSEEIAYFSWKKVPDIQNYIDKQRNESNYSYESVMSSISHLTFTISEINKMNTEELQEQKDNLLKEIQKMREALEVKETDLERICRRLENSKSETRSKEPEEKEESST